MTSRHRRHRLSRVVTVWAAVLVQLHLFFVVELHHHGDSVVLPDNPALAVAGKPQARAAQSASPSPLCPACQIALHGAVQPMADRSVPFALSEAGIALQANVLRCSAARQFRLCGRDPPALLS